MTKIFSQHVPDWTAALSTQTPLADRVSLLQNTLGTVFSDLTFALEMEDEKIRINCFGQGPNISTLNTFFIDQTFLSTEMGRQHFDQYLDSVVVWSASQLKPSKM